jgi:hypothetical protein
MRGRHHPGCVMVGAVPIPGTSRAPFDVSESGGGGGGGGGDVRDYHGLPAGFSYPFCI